MKNSSETLGQNLRRFRLDRGLSQLDLAKMLKVDKSYISNIENAKSNPTLSTIERLANLLKVSISELLS